MVNCWTGCRLCGVCMYKRTSRIRHSCEQAHLHSDGHGFQAEWFGASKSCLIESTYVHKAFPSSARVSAACVTVLLTLTFRRLSFVHNIKAVWNLLCIASQSSSYPRLPSSP